MSPKAVRGRNEGHVRPTEEEIREVVETFYGRVREDELLGPVFEERLDGRWEAHLDKMVDFWSTILLATGRYEGNPIRTHRRLARIGPAHFERWLDLFGPVVREILSPPAAADIYARAVRMRMVLESNLNPPVEAEH